MNKKTIGIKTSKKFELSQAEIFKRAKDLKFYYIRILIDQYKNGEYHNDKLLKSVLELIQKKCREENKLLNIQIDIAVTLNTGYV